MLKKISNDKSALMSGVQLAQDAIANQAQQAQVEQGPSSKDIHKTVFLLNLVMVHRLKIQ